MKIIPKKAVTAFYRDALRSRRTTAEKLLARPDHLFRRILREVRPHTGRALDLGYGSGSYAMLMAKAGYAVTAVDMLPKAIFQHRIPRLLRAKIIIKQQNIAVVKPEKKQIRLVVARDSLHFLTASEVAKVLRRVIHASARQSVHYLTFFTDIQRSTAAGERIRIAGESNLTKSAFLRLLRNAYQGWDLQVQAKKHKELNHGGLASPFSFIANRTTVIASHGKKLPRLCK